MCPKRDCGVTMKSLLKKFKKYYPVDYHSPTRSSKRSHAEGEVLARLRDNWLRPPG